MIEHSIFKVFKENTAGEIEKTAAQVWGKPYFENNYGWCREMLLERQDVMAALGVLKLGMDYGDLMGVERDMIPLVYIARMMPDTIACLEQLGFPEAVIEDSLEDVETWVEVYRKYHGGRCGLERLEWVLRTVAGLVYRLGSFQYERVTYEFPYHIYRNRDTAEYRALAAQGLWVDQDGYLAGTNGRPCHSRKQTKLVMGAESVTGFAVNLEIGVVEMEKLVSLDLREWKLVLAPGMKGMAIHIPAGADLSDERLRESLLMAEKYLGDKTSMVFSVVLCDSWLLDSHLVHLLPEDGRICSFMKKFYKLPVMESEPQIFERVMGFDFKREDMENFHALTRLQKNLQNYVLGGGEVFTTAGFLPLESYL